MGAGLLSMVIRFTLGKPAYARYEEKLMVLLEKAVHGKRQSEFPVYSVLLEKMDVRDLQMFLSTMLILLPHLWGFVI